MIIKIIIFIGIIGLLVMLGLLPKLILFAHGISGCIEGESSPHIIQRWGKFYLLALEQCLLTAVVDKFIIIKTQFILLHEDYQLYVLPRILESKKMAKSGRTKQKEADLEYNVAKQVEKMIRYRQNSCLNIFLNSNVMVGKLQIL